ncbi:metal ABC transporter ATP-binding protein [Rhodococcus rhodnii]|uniref:ABC metal transporter n=2 Tax=Rhodococcus rhodnii TaxID=38312 RepID=R7WJL1_9NOCA|nr:metal ABC transporter ATP-binding protein [Rhodococcus rhodnii]EOM75487.1 ABC metal transporter [Rhodococcus rhodnii LMG 5362]TXG90495.1 metal ABC transporter ATP-binding protein [Rhodococcus rhodnii]
MTAAPDSTAPDSVVLESVTVDYGEVRALSDVSLRLPPGTVTGLIGANGAGKSTLMKVITGVLTPTTGTVMVAGGSTTAARRRGVVAYVPQSERIDWDFPLSVRDVVATGRYGHARWFRGLRRADRDAVAEALDLAGLRDLADRQIGQLSGGQRKRVFVARALAQQASILLLDEPFAGVDKGSEAGIVALLRDLATGGATILVATHDLHSLPSLADRAIVVDGRIIAAGPTADVVRPEILARTFGLDEAS